MTYNSSYYSNNNSDTKNPITVELDDYVDLKIKESTNNLRTQYNELKSKYEDKQNILDKKFMDKYGEQLKEAKREIEYLQDIIFSKDSKIKKYEKILKVLSSKWFLGNIVVKTCKKYNSLWESVESTIKTK